MIDYYEVQVLWIKEQPTVVLMVVLVHHRSLCSQENALIKRLLHLKHFQQNKTVPFS